MLAHLFKTDVFDDGHNLESKVISIFMLKVYLSALLSSFGMAKFLQLGPCQLVPQNKMGIGIILITIANFLGLSWKFYSIIGALDAYVETLNSSYGPTLEFFEMFWRSGCIALLPGLILVIILY